MTRDEVRALLLSFPGVEDGVSYGEPSFKVAGKFFTWLRPKLDDSIVVHLDNLDERELLIEMDPAAFHFTDHYRDYPIVLARIAAVDPVWLRAALERRWRKVAPKRLVKVYDAA
ncbi:MAG: MmcQ/YjbR family DNA-binding protein [Alphaproteobacteria bacterium]|uniref:MmcQ/YjbR family DNA-binding protein n=1 Tax=Brevundimonas sp. TaxID=1871086 RepID=UPI001D6AFEED|nr:MmcQ/YjbR family DNA-binding protein [Alphaproteobacteria bacterium]MBU2165804.1 MmcQ/YjbR family DNA-binding protein [Alphaproteobacteria bacterium]MBU2230533.1 MmcQ/YjbR family DNA-binding protein [Alphaproteobacteria bacterium]MBU2399482.1 MmcQ/YjbR family DNA-binding protein [Alphaproteobacteria bacterium]